MNRTKYRLLDVTPVPRKSERIATFERTVGWIWKRVDTFQIRGEINEEWFYYPEGDEIPMELHDHLDALVDEHTSKESHVHSVEFQKKQRLERWAAEGKKK